MQSDADLRSVFRFVPPLVLFKLRAFLSDSKFLVLGDRIYQVGYQVSLRHRQGDMNVI